MMKVLLNVLAIAACAATLGGVLGGCVSYGNTHALITPVGIAGYHGFKPSDTVREIDLPERTTPDRLAATNERRNDDGIDHHE